MITPILHKAHTDAEATEDGAEARMRQALGKLGTARAGKPEAPRRATCQATPGAGRHRFRRDGEVSVVRISLAGGGRGTERPTHAPAEPVGDGQGQTGEDWVQGGGESARQVQELTDQLRATQTRLGHAELAADEATRAAQARQEEAASLRQRLDEAGAILAQVRAQLATSERAREDMERRGHATWRSDPAVDAPEGTAPRRKVGRPLGSTSRVRSEVTANEPEAVKWWAGD